MNKSGFCAIVLGACFPLASLAYIDPGSGSALVSGLIGTCVVLMMYLKTGWHALLALLTKLKHKLRHQVGK